MSDSSLSFEKCESDDKNQGWTVAGSPEAEGDIVVTQTGNLTNSIPSRLVRVSAVGLRLRPTLKSLKNMKCLMRPKPRVDECIRRRPVTRDSSIVGGFWPSGLDWRQFISEELNVNSGAVNDYSGVVLLSDVRWGSLCLANEGRGLVGFKNCTGSEIFSLVPRDFLSDDGSL